VAGVLRDDRVAESKRDRRLVALQHPGGVADGSVAAAATLKEEPPVPRGRQTQPEGDRVLLTVYPDAFVQSADDFTVLRQCGLAGCAGAAGLQRSCCIHRCRGDPQRHPVRRGGGRHRRTVPRTPGAAGLESRYSGGRAAR
jgi:hypothetical protein